MYFGGLNLVFLNGALLINQTLFLQCLLHGRHALLEILDHSGHFFGLVLLTCRIMLNQLALDGRDRIFDLFSMLDLLLPLFLFLGSLFLTLLL